LAKPRPLGPLESTLEVFGWVVEFREVVPFVVCAAVLLCWERGGDSSPGAAALRALCGGVCGPLVALSFSVVEEGKRSISVSDMVVVLEVGGGRAEEGVDKDVWLSAWETSSDEVWSCLGFFEAGLGEVLLAEDDMSRVCV
jgi:hypothetical protein